MCIQMLLLQDMVGFPAGVKFDPSDQELIEHLESMVKEGGSRAHPLIGDFIHTIDQGNDGICYTHPENLPGEMTLPFNLYTHIATIISYVLSATTNLEVGPDRIYLILEREPSSYS